MKMKIKDILRVTNGELVVGKEELECNEFSKDTRTIKEKDVYIGIKGESFDGNNFYKDAFDKGASVCILDNIDIKEIPDNYKNKTIVKVENTSIIGSILVIIFYTFITILFYIIKKILKKKV